MEREELLARVDRAILGEPNSCLSEHYTTLLEVRRVLRDGPAESSPFAGTAKDSSTPPQPTLSQCWETISEFIELGYEGDELDEMADVVARFEHALERLNRFFQALEP